jgi:hypothetical protein
METEKLKAERLRKMQGHAKVIKLEKKIPLKKNPHDDGPMIGS